MLIYGKEIHFIKLSVLVDPTQIRGDPPQLGFGGLVHYCET